MGLRVDGEEVFGPGPHTVIPAPVERRFQESAFPGLAGVRILALREDRGELQQFGLLVGEDDSPIGAECNLIDILKAVDTLVQDGVHSLVDEYQHWWGGVMLVEWAPAGPRELSRQGAVWRVALPYRARWLCTEGVVQS